MAREASGEVAVSQLLARRIVDRELGTSFDALDPASRAEWIALEDELERFVDRLRDDPVDESDENAATRTYLARLAQANLLGLVVPARFGGRFAEPRATAMCLARQWFARHSGVLDTAFVMQGLGSYPLVLAQSDLCATVLPAIARGEHVGAFAITETEAGSDIAGMRTTARQDGDTIRIDGEKTFISNAPLATAYVLFAREGERDDGRPAHSAFFVPADSPGIRVTPIRVIAPHPIGMVTFEGVRIPASHRIGAPGRGLDLALRNLDQFRVTVGAAALGIADRAFEVMVEHLATRVQFGKPLAEQQGLRFALAELATEHMAAQLLVYRAAGARDRGATTPERPAMAKLAATETAQRVVDRAVQSLGGLGVTVGQVPERLYREVRALRIYEGTSEIQKLVIARALFGR